MRPTPSRQTLLLAGANDASRRALARHLDSAFQVDVTHFWTPEDLATVSVTALPAVQAVLLLVDAPGVDNALIGRLRRACEGREIRFVTSLRRTEALDRAMVLAGFVPAVSPVAPLEAPARPQAASEPPTGPNPDPVPESAPAPAPEAPAPAPVPAVSVPAPEPVRAQPAAPSWDECVERLKDALQALRDHHGVEEVLWSAKEPIHITRRVDESR